MYVIFVFEMWEDGLKNHLFQWATLHWLLYLSLQLKNMNRLCVAWGRQIESLHTEGQGTDAHTSVEG